MPILQASAWAYPRSAHLIANPYRKDSCFHNSRYHTGKCRERYYTLVPQPRYRRKHMDRSSLVESVVLMFIAHARSLHFLRGDGLLFHTDFWISVGVAGFVLLVFAADLALQYY